ncbi:MAG: HEAT repeat domain-containing protein, partial [Planctomycetota bacterium]
MRNLVLAVLVLGFAFCHAGFAQEEGGEPKEAEGGVQARIKKWIAELGDPSFEVREKASEGLKSVGKEALPALREVLKTAKDMEVKYRAETLVAVIEKALEVERIKSLPKVKVGPLVEESNVSVNGVSVKWGRDEAGNVLLRYLDPNTGKERECTATSWKDFMQRFPEETKTYRVTEKGPDPMGGGIQFGGVRIQVGRVLAKPAIKKVTEPKSLHLRSVGVTVEPVPELLHYHLGIPKGKGAMVRSVDSGGRGEKLGLRKFDILLGVDGKTVESL